MQPNASQDRFCNLGGQLRHKTQNRLTSALMLPLQSAGNNGVALGLKGKRKLITEAAPLKLEIWIDVLQLLFFFF